MRAHKRIWAAITLSFLILFQLSAQDFGKKYDGPDDPAADPVHEREGRMDGNNISIVYRNNTEISDDRSASSRWPNTYYGNNMNDGIGLLVGARVTITDGSTPVTDASEMAALAGQGKLDTLYFLETNYREEMDMDPTGRTEWGFHAVGGYFNPFGETPAISDDAASWPAAGWPARGGESKWPGEWNGRFGRGITMAHLETFFVANDAQDQEYLGEDDQVKYYPRPGVFIGDKDPRVSTQRGAPWGGLGVRVEQRGYQWDNPQARDAIFWEYLVANISDYNLPNTVFGYWIDNDIGGENQDGEGGAFDAYVDMAYSWDLDGAGQGGYRTGTQGFAFLESPGIAGDNVDNDLDGLIDERRDNDPGSIIGPEEGIDNLSDFLRFYYLKHDDLRSHWSGDEDQDWQDGIDVNGNGQYDFSEFAGDDVGLDGVGPGDLNYVEPDEGEGNHRPDFVEGRGCEPNYNWTDISETDMLGLTSFTLSEIPLHVDPYAGWFRNDKSMWDLMTSGLLIDELAEATNLGERFATGPFPLFKGLTERISLCELHSYDPQAGLLAPSHDAPALYNLKRIVQMIYERDYRFAQPPIMPALTATPGDGFVILTWDNTSDLRTRDPFLANQNDFEGYKLYRSTDRKMSDPEIITDGYGTPFAKKPIFECDKIDDIQGFADFGLVNGQGYYLGAETGLTHQFVDRDVQNGRTYFYALVAYDYGVHPDSLKWKADDAGSGDRTGISPTENRITIKLDDAEEVIAVSRNIAIVTPGTKPADYAVDIESIVDYQDALGTGIITPEILIPEDVKSGHTYEITFQNFIVDPVLRMPEFGGLYTANGMKIHDVTGDIPQLVYSDTLAMKAESEELYTTQYFTILDINRALHKDAWTIRNDEDMQTGIFDGLQLSINTPVDTAALDKESTGWLTPTNAAMKVIFPRTGKQRFPWDYDIVFQNEDSVYIGTINRAQRGTKDEYGDDIDTDSLLVQWPFNFYVENINHPHAGSGGPNYLDIFIHDRNGNQSWDPLEDRLVVGHVSASGRWGETVMILDFSGAASEAELPKPGDVYNIRFTRPFYKTDSLRFTINLETTTSGEKSRENMENIKVIPNPYVATNVMEPSVSNPNFNQRRRLMFANIPERCAIKIFTTSGVFVDEINAPEDGLVTFGGLGQDTGGIIHWDMLTHEGLEIAAGVYFYHVENRDTGDEKMGKFAVIK